MTHTNTILHQVLKNVPRHEFEKLANQYDGDRRRGAFSRWSQFVALAVGQLASRSSLRDIEATMDSQTAIRYHTACQPVKRTTLARANEKLDGDFYQSLFQRLYQRCQRSSSKKSFKFKGKLFSLDASLISVSLKLFPTANYNTMKGAFKLHVGLDHDGLIPAFAAVTPGKDSDMSQAKMMRFPKGSVVVFDRGYNDLGWHETLSKQGVFYVSRLRANALYKVVEQRDCSTLDHVTSDHIIQYSGKRAKEEGWRPIRKVGYRDPETGKHYVFVTNQLNWSAKMVAEIYKQRWQIELLFKWIKQNLKIKSFLGLSINAVKTQIFIALCIYLLLGFIKYQSRAGSSLQQIFRLIQVNLFARRSLVELIKPPPIEQASPAQMMLGGFG
ncbi:IS4 family transposase [bacterium]|nr:IS4 family transposase [bacterium]